MSDNDLIEELDDDEPVQPAFDSEELVSELERRCAAAGWDFGPADTPFGRPVFETKLPAGRQSVPIRLVDARRMRELLEIEFEGYSGVGDYAAICHYLDGTIECALATLVPGGLTSIYETLLGVSPRDSEAENAEIRIASDSGSKVELRIGTATTELWVLGGIRSPSRLRRLSLRIEGLKISRQEEAIELLEQLSSSLFFQIDIAHNMPLSLGRRRSSGIRTGMRRRVVNPPEVNFPRVEYDREPLSLYWYARSATGMPLLQFLAYYQTVEFYFPSYAQAEARRKVRNVLKSPVFRIDRDADLAKVLLAANSGSSGFGDERSQLRATLHECLEPGALREFLTESEERVKHFSSKTKGLTDKRLTIGNPDADLRNDVADRIYEIRCKIVHTKSGARDGEFELLLPFSKEAELLYPDIILIQYVAREVLISASSDLQC